jgi:hypothetical protein
LYFFYQEKQTIWHMNILTPLQKLVSLSLFFFQVFRTIYLYWLALSLGHTLGIYHMAEMNAKGLARGSNCRTALHVSYHVSE